jgi:hypothetical protein
MAEMNSGGLRDLSDEKLEKLVASLSSLHDGELGIPLLVACGKAAIRPLREALLHGRASSVFIPRQRVVWALAELGAKDVLLEYLAMTRKIADPMLRHSEEAVKNTAARALAAWRTEDVFNALLQKLSARLLPGAIESLGQFQRVEPLPHYVHALEDDVCRSSAEDAIEKLGEEARAALINAARTPDPSGNYESPSSICRRRSALKLLSTLRVSAVDWDQLAALLHDQDAEIVARTAWVALEAGNGQDKQLAARCLVGALPRVNWLLQADIESWLIEHFDAAQECIASEVARRQAKTQETQAHDKVLRLLIAILEAKQSPGAVDAR